MPDTDLNDYTDVNEDINTDLPESTAPMMNSQMDHKRSCFNPSAQADAGFGYSYSYRCQC